MSFTGNVLGNNKTVALHTLGCKLNFSESSSIARMFQQQGYERVEMTESPDIVVINTCSVTDNADKKCRQAVREARRSSENPYIIVIGCYAQLKPREIASIPGVDAVLGASEKFRLLELLDGFEKHSKAIVMASDIADARTFNSAYSINDRTRTFLKIQDGCDYSCSFCTIPLARGKSRSDTIENVLAAARDIASRGVKEIVLTGVNTGDFGIRDGKRHYRFIDLMKELDNVEGVERIRISSIEPNLLTPEIIQFVAVSNKFAHHFHIPLQSGSDKILWSHAPQISAPIWYTGRVTDIKNLMPDCCIGVDVIVGFPGESDDDFMDTYQFINQLDISYLHVFTYSERPNTLASEIDDVVPQEKRAERSRMLRTLSEKKRRNFYEQFEGRTMKVLFENDFEAGKIHGFSGNYIRIGVPADKGLVNGIYDVALTSITPSGVMAGELMAEIPKGI
ncbi:MAG: tRNA (N(6)-L-threonylcarbamoyladenosine(37)-C(2))-methylthiotransferase MtaB [Cyclobacteriaceae bacterium]|nr:tRNA (N(6)-L-threonylcarbamoyladenosine(37)-C(2))-methylthiotransferase MtaB [Cyclobacteriaceae bacterium]